ncbi:hypothetical protein KPH14_004577 [Odynerus spinipes]|uniref:Uncharacterized protein n=1 Tax=Odynerus spinipes TaxID=1348599 RepID=A0AAD9VQE1_9HYME|nr:hypothetical protein KPH14_004577 [Odynerus spinipes]
MPFGKSFDLPRWVHAGRGGSENTPPWRTRRAMCRTWGSQWRSMARASSIRSTRSNISPAGIAGGTWTGLNLARRILNTVNSSSHREPIGTFKNINDLLF